MAKQLCLKVKSAFSGFEGDWQWQHCQDLIPGTCRFQHRDMTGLQKEFVIFYDILDKWFFFKSLSIWTVWLDCRANMKKYPVVFEQCNKLFEHCKNRELPSLLDQALFKFGEKCKHSNSTNLKLKHRKNCECCPGHYLILDHYSSI